jgi:hypothetical protein
MSSSIWGEIEVDPYARRQLLAFEIAHDLLKHPFRERADEAVAFGKVDEFRR